MANILNPDKPEVISKIDINETDKKGVLSVTVTINAAYQKEVYETIFKQKAKEVTVEGFRKGKAPREVVEPKIYPEVAQSMLEQIVYIASAELVTKLPRDYIVLDASTVEKVDFKVVESPIQIKFKVYYVKGVKLPKLEDFKVTLDKDKVKVTDEEVEASIKQVFEQWKLQQKQSKKTAQNGNKDNQGTVAQNYEMNDEWVKQLGIPNVDTMDKLKEYVKGLLSKEKEAKLKQQLLEQTLDKIVEAMNIDIPQDLVNKRVEQEIERQRKEVERYGITLEKYLEYYKKNLEELKKELTQQVEADYKQEVLRQLYIREFKISLDKEDHAYMELAMGQLKVPPQALQDFNVLSTIARLALVFKVYDDIAQKIGLGLVYKSLISEHTHDHSHHHDHAHDHVHDIMPDKENKKAEASKDNAGENNKKGSASKILIADE